MKRFSGFPARTEFTPLPNAFFSNLLLQITDIAELKATLYLIAVLYRKKGYPRFVTGSELLGDSSLISSLKEADRPPDEVLRDALKLAVERGTLLHIVLDKDEDVYFLNDEPGRQAVAKIESGELKLGGQKIKKPAYVQTEEPSDIFTLYEQNIGMLTPMIAEELQEAEKLYPQNWIADAVKEAVLYNKRNIKYIIKILENWVAEGKSDGTHRRHPEKTDPDKYVKGKYGHMVQR